MKIRFLHDGNFDINNGVSHFQRGDVVEANKADAERLVEGKNAEYVNAGGLYKAESDTFIQSDETPITRKKGKVKDGDR